VFSFSREVHAVSRFLTTEEAAELLNVSEKTICSYIKSGRLAGIRVGGRYVIPAAALDALEAVALASAHGGDAA